MESPHTPDNWSAAAAEYEANVSDFTGGYVADLLDRLAPSPDHRALEVAAGPGVATVALAARCRHVLATDYAAGMVERLRARLARESIENVECAQMDGQALEVEDASFDVALSSFGLMLFADRAAGFREMRRALRPGGRAVVSAWSGPEKFEAFGVFGAAVRRALPDLPAPPAPPAVFSLADPEVFAGEMTAAGFSEVRIEQVTRTFEQPSAAAFWEVMISSAPPAQVLLARIGAENTSRLRDALFQILGDRFGDGPVRLSSEATIGVGTVPAA